MISIQKIAIAHTTSLQQRQFVEYLTEPKKIESWFAGKQSTCKSNPVKNAIEIMILQDSYLEWILPNEVTLAIAQNSEIPLRFTIHQIDFELNGPIISEIKIELEPTAVGTKIGIEVSGAFSDDLRTEVEDNWSFIAKISPSGAIAK